MSQFLATTGRMKMTPPPASGAGQRERLQAALDNERGSAYLLAPDLSIQLVNHGWRRFATENGAPELASGWSSAGPISRFIAPPLREWVDARLFRILKRQEAWSNVYECSSATVYRKFNMRVEPTPHWNGLVVVHSLVVEARLPSREGVVDERAPQFTDSRGLIVACSCCGRVRRPGDEARWDWVPGLVGPQTKNASHGICPTCDFQYYGD